MAAPKLRFKEFDEDWSKTTLNDIAEINPPSSSLPDKFIYIDLESVKNGRLLAENNIELKNAPSRAQRLLQKDDVLFQVVRPYQQNNLYFEKEGSYVASTGYAQIRANANSSFLYHMLHEEQFLSEVINRCTGTSYPAINSKDLSSIEVYTPSLKEQTKIATFLSTVDTKIDELIQKHELLTEYKKGMMQQIFSQKLRFQADDGSDFEDWEDKNILNIAHVFIGLVTTMTKHYENSGTPLIRNSDIKKNKILINNLIFLNSDFADMHENRKLKTNDIVTVHTGDVGVSSTIPKDLNGAIGFATINTRIFDNQINPNYIACYFNSYEFINWCISVSTGDGRQNLNLRDFKKVVIPTPCLNEQIKITNFLTTIDQKTDNVAEQIDHAKTWKKGLLQQMFV